MQSIHFSTKLSKLFSLLLPVLLITVTQSTQVKFSYFQAPEFPVLHLGIKNISLLPFNGDTQDIIRKTLFTKLHSIKPKVKLSLIAELPSTSAADRVFIEGNVAFDFSGHKAQCFTILKFRHPYFNSPLFETRLLADTVSKEHNRAEKIHIIAKAIAENGLLLFSPTPKELSVSLEPLNISATLKQITKLIEDNYLKKALELLMQNKSQIEQQLFSNPGTQKITQEYSATCLLIGFIYELTNRLGTAKSYYQISSQYSPQKGEMKSLCQDCNERIDSRIKQWSVIKSYLK
jgi:hypothetical protein